MTDILKLEKLNLQNIKQIYISNECPIGSFYIKENNLIISWEDYLSIDEALDVSLDQYLNIPVDLLKKT